MKEKEETATQKALQWNGFKVVKLMVTSHFSIIQIPECVYRILNYSLLTTKLGIETESKPCQAQNILKMND